MRIDLTKAAKAKPGDEVVIRCSLPRKVQHARISVWSSCGGAEFSPHVQNAMMNLATNGEVAMVSPMYTSLHELRKHHKISFIADENMLVLVKQEVDDKQTPLASASIAVYGSFRQRIRYELRKFLAWFRNKRKEGNHVGTPI